MALYVYENETINAVVVQSQRGSSGYNLVRVSVVFEEVVDLLGVFPRAVQGVASADSASLFNVSIKGSVFEQVVLSMQMPEGINRHLRAAKAFATSAEVDSL